MVDSAGSADFIGCALDLSIMVNYLLSPSVFQEPKYASVAHTNARPNEHDDIHQADLGPLSVTGFVLLCS
ncbi:hypothetical protein N7493_005255 [Penicillium malachiteum]|uniref:Uncharacterized protein n=1 Tax=Penicillium malachiteum TaxID=1324776 RepID=A0AAD6HMB4_9EURO|nr:hypothetical protein N7493_005255 [Penicillium malachiteum]